MKRVLMVILVLFVASAAWGDSILYTLDFNGHFADGRTLHGDGLFLQSAGGQIIYGSGNNRFHGSISPTMLWSGSTFSGTFAGIQQAFGYSATCGTYHPHPLLQPLQFHLLRYGNLQWHLERERWKSLAKVQLDITSSRLITSVLSRTQHMDSPGLYRVGGNFGFGAELWFRL